MIRKRTSHSVDKYNLPVRHFRQSSSFPFIWFCMDNFLLLPYFVTISSDIDECSADSSPCDENADCTNSDGSYSCTCKQGFTGDGATCNGKGKVSCRPS